MTRIPLGRRTLTNNTVNVPAGVQRFGYPGDGKKVIVEYDAEEHALVYTPIGGRPDVDEDSILPKKAREYRRQLKQSREEAFREARNKFIRRADELDVGTQAELAEIFDMSQPSISQILNEEQPEGEDETDPRVVLTADD